MSGLGGSRATGADQPCPCGSTSAYGRCCGPLLAGELRAETAEQLMRSRFTAFAVGDAGHLSRTWHPRTRPEPVEVSAGIRWTGLEVVDTVAGSVSEDRGEVEFRAHWMAEGPPVQRGVQHERSRFERRAGRWLYVDGDQP